VSSEHCGRALSCLQVTPPMNIVVRPPNTRNANCPNRFIQEALFGRTVTPAERLRQHQRALAKAQRELDRERTKLEQSEKKLIMDIKKSAKAGQLVRSPFFPLKPGLLLPVFAECVQGHGEGLGPHPPLCPEILPDAHAIAGGRSAHPDAAQ
jgi:hypothetical protein